MKGYHANIEKLSLSNTNFRKVLFTAKYCQLVVMSLKPREEIGLEVHPKVDQFFRFEQGEGKVLIDGQELNVHQDDVVIIPAGSEHNIINSSEKEELKLYTIYSPPNHPEGTVHPTKKEAEEAEKLEH
ncbi:cupin [Candidatus Woesebacteria bacterium RIFCSPHIGHO2_01_FULL_39_32]|uniref:Cupin n=1 Tax=Candidatus Woesebacteria bacterium RIFCSPLOWO2_01_FULL_39_25 TaxID=1802521 RepID=A0A1F8BLZ4_9BACT|nr:MAG: cupin [Candidatus Woesebacteria bacterium GWB1_37_5]OGM25532.1 MAG: cupin [Candidatus Woesebacteria bacterium RIFCSPHIGHO2_01_FULL_39_32]OGM36812.1 MAG: cupin [Candidatus Woesebacteria bacterium RIFCSPHIGHO2_12_FULL_38_11]OGM65063.1 MAG: cupin [Candidatus Woesebacteria bacterium RIFCSPLOWO2_01_FULL_39_25]